ncbi:sodium:solute symporter family protein [Candidatus Cardinium hertigii]|uniref:sodium:solute symporter family protein n=1 Tax=Candidatus Cardinium hertigii TaxID=247481 RepID=UPI003D7C53B3
MYRRDTSFRDYALGHRQFSTATIVATIVACSCPGGVLRLAIEYASYGSWFMLDRIILMFCPLLLLSWLAQSMSKFMDHLSMPESMAVVYGRCARLITALFELCSGMIMIAFQIRLISDTVSLFIPSVSSLAITILITIVMVVYAMFGGARAIASIDVWQCIVFSMCMLVLVCWLFKVTNNLIINKIDFLKSQKQFINIIPPDRKIPLIFRYLSALFGPVAPYLVHYLYMCKRTVQAKKAYLYAGIFSSAIIACTLVIGLLVFIRFPNIPSTAIWNHFLSNLSFFLRGVVCVIMLSFAMSTVDSRLHVASIMFAYDIPKSIGCFSRLLNLHQVQVVRVALLAVALLAMVLGFYCSISILDKILVWHGRLYVSVIIAPFILAVLGFHTSSSVALIGMVTGLLSMLAWQKWMVPILHTTSGHVPCMLMNGLVMVLVHYLLRSTTNKLDQPLDRVQSIQQVNKKTGYKKQA